MAELYLVMAWEPPHTQSQRYADTGEHCPATVIGSFRDVDEARAMIREVAEEIQRVTAMLVERLSDEELETIAYRADEDFMIGIEPNGDVIWQKEVIVASKLVEYGLVEVVPLPVFQLSIPGDEFGEPGPQDTMYLQSENGQRVLAAWGITVVEAPR